MSNKIYINMLILKIMFLILSFRETDVRVNV